MRFYFLLTTLKVSFLRSVEIPRTSHTANLRNHKTKVCFFLSGWYYGFRIQPYINYIKGAIASKFFPQTCKSRIFCRCGSAEPFDVHSLSAKLTSVQSWVGESAAHIWQTIYTGILLVIFGGSLKVYCTLHPHVSQHR